MLYIIRKLGKKNIQCFWKGAKLSAPNPQMSSLVENEKLPVLFECKCLRTFLWLSIFLLLRHFSSCFPPAGRKFLMPYHRKWPQTWWVRLCLLMWGIIWVKQCSSGSVFLVCQRGHFTGLCQEFYYSQNCFAFIHWVRELNQINIIRFVLNKSMLAASCRFMILLGWANNSFRYFTKYERCNVWFTVVGPPFPCFLKTLLLF